MSLLFSKNVQLQCISFNYALLPQLLCATLRRDTPPTDWFPGKKMMPVAETDYRRNCPHQNIYCKCRKLAFKKHSFLQIQFPALTTSFGVDSTACSSNSAINSSDWRHFFVPTSQCRLEFLSVRKECINAHAHHGLTPSGSRQSWVVCVSWNLVSMLRFKLPDKVFILL